MAGQLTKGIELINDIPGCGPMADRGSTVTYNARLFLRRGDEVTRDARLIARHKEHLVTRCVEGVELVDHTTTLGKRQAIAGVERSLYGMQVGGYREVLASAHLCYRESGILGLIPPNAMLRIHLWVRDVQGPTTGQRR